MSEASATLAAPAQPSLSMLPFEQQIYLRSPLGFFATTAVIFAVAFGSFLVAATIAHVPILLATNPLSGAAWPAFVLSLLCTAALAMQRYGRIAEARDVAAYARILTGGMQSALDLTSVMARNLHLRLPTLFGLVIGLAISPLLHVGGPHESVLMLIWFGAATTLLVVLFTRGVAQSRAGNAGYKLMLDAELKIDLLRTDTLSVLGRSAARTALIWFIISAISCLFFVGGDINWLTMLLIVSCVAMGLILFISIMNRIHRQIVTVKRAELEQIRLRIDLLRSSLHEDAFASAKLHGLLAYEKRISDAPEWPFDQSTIVRIGAYILIPTVPWFGQAIVQYYIEHLGH
ncbi:MAG TPA: hypothetical protein VGG48_13305 [Rhizomicrobium sp.]|jgi:hypothetical protein